ncbi:hypothetical protein F0601_11075 [Salmonella enterica]|nr:hypothetical protein [Salmonella enterica]
MSPACLAACSIAGEKIKKPQLLARIERLEQHGQTVIPGLTN